MDLTNMAIIKQDELDNLELQVKALKKELIETKERYKYDVSSNAKYTYIIEDTMLGLCMDGENMKNT